MAKLSAGGMGELYVAEHRLLGARFALKLLGPALRGSAAAERRFRQEAQLGAELCHPNLVRIFDFEPAGRAPYFAMELLQGRDLRNLLRAEPQLSLGRGVRLVRDALAGLAIAHARGIVHRDLKPSNLFVVDPGPREQGKVLDFGVARVNGRADPSSEPLTLGDRPLGTLAYMAPEQIRDARNVDARADVYSVCAILLEALSGQRRFDSESVPEQIFRTLNETPPRLDTFVACPRTLADVIERGLSRNPAQRQADATELLRELEPFASGEPNAAPVIVAGGSSARRNNQILTFLVGIGLGVGLASLASSAHPFATPTSPSGLTVAVVQPPPAAEPSSVTPPATIDAPVATPAQAPAPISIPKKRAEAAQPRPPASIGLERTNPYD